MEREIIEEMECRLYRDGSVPGQLFYVRPNGVSEDGISRELRGGIEYEDEERLRGIPPGAKVKITNVRTLFVPQETESVSGQLAWACGRRGRTWYSLTRESEVTVIEVCRHEWQHHHVITHDPEIYPDDCCPGGLLCSVDSHCVLCKAFDSGICDTPCPLCDHSMSIEEAYAPHGHVWTCDACGSSRPLEDGWLGGDEE